MDGPSSTPAGRIDGNGPAASVLSGVAGGACCFAGAIAAGLGLGGVSVLEAMMDRYQPLFLVASVWLMGVWLGRAARGAERAGVGVRGVLRVAGRPAVVMGVTWSVTLVVAMIAARVAGLG
jgi:hypothetical protein